ncbi:Glycosyltransferase sdnJ [Lachnellula suecica]|uniref:Glycosyltransferase sdnJ n=1 Tax=Lachnellula suecica TaxID=602035 RepID=A0A8T9CDA6_9HELO|nr:Glycosyltransferase sdnJ [Lachnellula suecica]
MADTMKILFFTNSEYGQSNVVVATAYELLHRGCEIHIASFAADEDLGSAFTKRIDALNNGEYGTLPTDSKPVTFHRITGESMVESWQRRSKLTPDIAMTHGCGLKHAPLAYRSLMPVMGSEGPEYLTAVESCVAALKLVQPKVIVVDSSFPQGHDAARMMNLNYVVLTPNSFRETIGAIQPRGYGFWGIPAYPVSWSKVPLNIYLNARMIYAFFTAPIIKDIEKFRKEHGLSGRYPHLDPYRKNLQYLIPSAPEIDFPMRNIPGNVTGCGPIVVPAPPLATTDPELEQWLRAKPTVMLNLGSHFITSDTFAKSIATAFSTLLLKCPNVQVLWKLNSRNGNDAQAKGILKEYIENGSVKMASWLNSTPSSILQSGHVKCAVHHGGANSYYEAVDAGVAQIILPGWYDTFDFAARVEYLEIGLWGSHRACKKGDFVYWDEFGDALLTVMDPKSAKGAEMVHNAKSLGGIARSYGGRKKAAEKIMEFAESGKYGAKTLEKDGVSVDVTKETTAVKVEEAHEGVV